MQKKRLDNIALQLTPKQWAIRLANEMRRYPCEEEFLKAVAKGTYRRTPYILPFSVLAQQAAELWPGNDPVNRLAAIQLSRKLRGEFQALKLLISSVNETSESKAATWRVKAALRLSEFRAIVLEHTLSQTAQRAATWIEEHTPPTPDAKVEWQLLLEELLVHTDAGPVVDTAPEIAANVVPPRRFSLLADWADNSAMLLTEIVAHLAAVHRIQELYFDDRPILFKDTETELETAIQTVRDAIVLFDEYRNGSADRLGRQGKPQRDLSIDIEAIEQRAKLLAGAIGVEWETSAKNRGKADILEETNQHGDFIWQNFRKQMGLES